MVILPTCLRGFVKATHLALLHIVDAIRRLDGQTVSVHEAKSLGVETGLVIENVSIDRAGMQLIVGLVLLEGSFPVSHLNPNTKHFVHYGEATKRVGQYAAYTDGAHLTIPTTDIHHAMPSVHTRSWRQATN